MKNESDLKKTLSGLLVLAALILVLDFFTPGFDPLGFKFGRTATASLLIDYGKGGTRLFSGEIVSRMTVFDAFIASSLGGLKVDYVHNGHGLTFLSVDGRSGPLTVKVNDRLISLEDLNETFISQGDLIKTELP